MMGAIEFAIKLVLGFIVAFVLRAMFNGLGFSNGNTFGRGTAVAVGVIFASVTGLFWLLCALLFRCWYRTHRSVAALWYGFGLGLINTVWNAATVAQF